MSKMILVRILLRIILVTWTFTRIKTMEMELRMMKLSLWMMSVEGCMETYSQISRKNSSRLLITRRSIIS